MIGFVKIDGVRGLHITGSFTGRSLKSFKNPFIGDTFLTCIGVDGELAFGDITAPRLCSLTTGFVNRKTARPGKPTESDQLSLWAFDFLTEDTASMPYQQRLEALTGMVTMWQNLGAPVHVAPWKLLHSEEEALAFEEEALEAGYEGIILRTLDGLHKDGRASTKGKKPNAYLRLKRFVDFEGVVVGLLEAKENTNEKKTNELGRSERSTHQENMVPKGMVGTIKLRALADVLDPVTKAVVIAKDQVVDVGPGEMPHDQRTALWSAFIGQTGDSILNKVGKAKFFPKGIKDLPRFPTWVGLRAEEDMSE